MSSVQVLQMMEFAESERKRQRMGSYGGPPNMAHMQPHSEPPQAHHLAFSRPSLPHSIAPPPVSGYSQEHLPAEHRELPTPSPQHYAHHPTAGYGTPVHAPSPFPQEHTYGRTGFPGQPQQRSPVDTQQVSQFSRPLTAGPTPESYQGQHPAESMPGNAGYPDPPHTNGAIPHGLPLASHPDTMAGAPTPYGPPQTPMTPYSAATPFPTMTGSGYGGQPRRKAVRALQACDACRQRKAKCDEGRPACLYCKEAGIPCSYRDVPPPKQDRQITMLRTMIRDVDDRVQKGFEGMYSQIAQLLVQHGLSPTAISLNPLPDPDQKVEDDDDYQQQAEEPSSQPNPMPEVPGIESKDLKAQVINELAIPMEHTTAAQKLLRWPSIRAFVQDLNISESYVMDGEEGRGLLRIWGRGEGRAVDGGGLLPPAPETTLSEDGKLRYPSPNDYVGSPADNLWGVGPGQPSSPEARRVPHGEAGGLNADGTLRLDYSTVNRLTMTYMDKMHILHPFLNRDEITTMTLALAARCDYQPDTSRSSAPNSPFVVSGTLATQHALAVKQQQQQQQQQGPKRKRSAPTVTNMHAPTGTGIIRRQVPERSIQTAIVLLVLALGKICEHTRWLPGPVSDNESGPNQVWSPAGLRGDSPSMSVHQSPTSSQSGSFTSVASPNDLPDTTRRTSVETNQPGLRNVDIIPGLAYYGYAADILGNLAAGTELPHIQAFVLAGLYMGQLGRVIESWQWINRAGIAIQVLLRREPYKNLEQKSERLLRVTSTYWTAVQLESDILAELDVPPSGMSRYEDEMPIPLPLNVINNEGSEKELEVWQYYLSQITIRKLLNRVHTELYKSDDGKHSAWSSKVQGELERQLIQWRETLPDQLKWNDKEPPAKDINAARLRGKYWGAHYIIHRPFVHHALHPVHPHGTFPPLSSLSTDEATTPIKRRKSVPMGPPSSSPSYQLEAKVLESCKSCINAAYQSTIAFHNIESTFGRPIITNIFGTAHAQFGNLLVLQAALRSEILGPYVDREHVISLLSKTISFLRALSPLGPTFNMDAKILDHSLKRLMDEYPHYGRKP